MTLYEPLNTLKPVAPHIWLIDGPSIRFYGLPFSTRATVVRLGSGELWVHSPTKLTTGLASELKGLGPVAHLVAPNWIHYAHVAEWQEAFPDAISWAAPGAAERAASKGMALHFDRDLGPEAEAPWEGEIDQMIVEGSRVHREAVFFHPASRTLILTDLIENFEPGKMPWYLRPLLRLGGVMDPDGKMPRDMRASFLGHRDRLRAAVERMIAWQPERVILAHGRWYRENGVAELRRAFRFVL
ncbi:MAG TPA: DUF4336 domain-containing protein [Rhodobacteraceae bacterium]|nr:DUF4336 domain-containing protein [Paracoccaceae bacterium]